MKLNYFFKDKINENSDLTENRKMVLFLNKSLIYFIIDSLSIILSAKFFSFSLNCFLD